jgi:hypothetical protein
MRTQGILIALTLAASFAFTAPIMAQSGGAPVPGRTQASAIGKVVTATGTVAIERAGAVAASQADITGSVTPASSPQGSSVPQTSSVSRVKEGDLVYQGDVVTTGPDGRVSLTFADGTAFNVSHNARMELNEFVYNPNGKSNSSMFSLLKGTFTFVAGKIAKTGNMRLDTPVATMGIRGTTPHVVVSEDGTVKFSTLIEEKR